MKIKNKELYMLACGYALFAFSIFMPGDTMSAINYIIHILIGMLFNVAVSYLLRDCNGVINPVSHITFFYLLLLLSRNIYNMTDYMHLYHRQNRKYGNVIISLFTVMIILSMPAGKLKKLSYPCFSAVLILLAIILIMNFDKISPVNLYRVYERKNLFDRTLILFDYIVPLEISLFCEDKSDKKSTVFLHLCTAFVLITVSLLAFSCYSGNLLYSISPLQMLFQISTTELFNNFDAVYTLLLYFGYFSALILIIYAAKKVKQCCVNWFVPFIILLLYLYIVPKITYMMWNIFLIAFVVILLLGRKRYVDEEN